MVGWYFEVADSLLPGSVLLRRPKQVSQNDNCAFKFPFLSVVVLGIRCLLANRMPDRQIQKWECSENVDWHPADALSRLSLRRREK